MAERRYRDPQSFRQALDARLKEAAKSREQPVNQLRRDFVLGCFLARVFGELGDGWVLKGGTGLAVRVARARHTRDIDLSRAPLDQDASSSTVDAAVAELTTLVGRSERDPFVFELTRRADLTGTADGTQITVTTRLGTRTFDGFPIDLTVGLHTIGEVEMVTKRLPIEIDGVAPPPPFRLYPLVDQVADKVAAMYEHHGERPSGRYRDLVDLVILTRAGVLHDLDRTRLGTALRYQANRRGMHLPAAFVPPGPEWARQYRRIAAEAGLSVDLSDLTVSLKLVQDVLGDTLARAARDQQRP